MTQGHSALLATSEALERIERLNPHYCALATVTADDALRTAQQADTASVEGRWLGILHGMTLAVKDNIDTAGIRTACGSRLFANHVPNSDAPVVARLRQAGAVILGKAVMMELAFGVRSLDAVAGQCRNPWNSAHVPGGSSGGSVWPSALTCAPQHLALTPAGPFVCRPHSAVSLVFGRRSVTFPTVGA